MFGQLASSHLGGCKHKPQQGFGGQSLLANVLAMAQCP